MRFARIANFALGSLIVIVSGAVARGDVAPKNDRDSKLSGKTLQQWVRDFQDRDPSHRETAYRAMALYGRDGREALPGLINAIKTETDSGLRVHATIAIGMIGLDDKNLKNGVDALRRLLTNDTQGSVRFQAASALARIGPIANAAVPSLATAVQDKFSWEIRKAAAFGLGTVGLDPKNGPDLRALTALSGAVRDASSQVRQEAVRALVYLGPPIANPDAKNAVVQSLQRSMSEKTEKDETVSVWARVALMRMEQVNETQLSAIAKFLRSASVEPRVQAATALGTVGFEARSQVPALQETAGQDRESPVVMASLWALTQMGDSGKRALGQLAQHKDADLKKLAAEALESMGKPAASAPTPPAVTPAKK